MSEDTRIECRLGQTNCITNVITSLKGTEGKTADLSNFRNEWRL